MQVSCTLPLSVGTDTRSIGMRGEEVVVQHLIHDGFSVCARNYRQQYGEIDIIARKGDLLVFVEVKLRAASPFGLDHLVSRAKQRRISMVAREYMGRHNITNKVCQFDVALIERQGDGCYLTYIENAFVGDE